MVQQRIDHHISYKVNLGGIDAFALEVLIGVTARGEQDAGERVGDETIDFFGHRPIETPKAGFNMRDADQEFGGHDRASHGRVDVADHDHEVRLLLLANLLEFHHDSSGLIGVRPGANAEVNVGDRNAQVAKKNVGHAVVIVLARVDQNALQSRFALHLFHDWRDLHEVGPRADDIQYFHGRILPYVKPHPFHDVGFGPAQW